MARRQREQPGLVVSLLVGELSMLLERALCFFIPLLSRDIKPDICVRAGREAVCFGCS